MINELKVSHGGYTAKCVHTFGKGDFFCVVDAGKDGCVKFNADSVTDVIQKLKETVESLNARKD
jgi:hypothetical protein